MDTKLTLKLDQGVIEIAKEYAKMQHTSLSKLIESYLQNITKKDEEEIEISPFVKSLTGVIKLSADLDYKKEYRKHLAEKYK